VGIKRTFEKEVFKCNYKGVIHPRPEGRGLPLIVMLNKIKDMKLMGDDEVWLSQLV